MNKITFLLGNKITEIDFAKRSDINTNTTVLNYLRTVAERKSVKEGCGEGDCGACTVVLASLTQNNTLSYQAYNSCLLLLPTLHGKHLITTEDLAEGNELHEIQKSIISSDATQCGYCTPGIAMSMFAIYKNYDSPSQEEINDALAGNLCRCTGYANISTATHSALQNKKYDRFDKNQETVIEKLSAIPKKNIEIVTEDYAYFVPQNLETALFLRKSFNKAVIINGSTDIALRITKRKETINQIIDISEVAELKEIAESETDYIIGAGVTLNELKTFSLNKMPALCEMIALFGAKQIRNKATIGGNIATASPIGDIAMTLLAYNAKVVVTGEMDRILELKDFIQGYRKTDLHADEILKAVVIPKFTKDNIIKSYKISKRKNLDISTVSAAFNLCLDGKNVKNIVIAYGGMAEKIKRAEALEQFFIGKPWTRQTIEESKVLIDKEFAPISDARSSKEARTIMAKNLILKFWTETNI